MTEQQISIRTNELIVDKNAIQRFENVPKTGEHGKPVSMKDSLEW